jgi:hypothetical protein
LGWRAQQQQQLAHCNPMQMPAVRVVFIILIPAAPRSIHQQHSGVSVITMCPRWLISTPRLRLPNQPGTSRSRSYRIKSSVSKQDGRDRS